MPKIDTLNQGQRLQVSSPVPISSTESARATGEEISKVGVQLGDFAKTLLKLDEERTADQERNTAAQFKASGEILGKNALTYATQNYKDPEGNDQIPIAKEFFDAQMGPQIDAIKDPHLKAIAMQSASAAWEQRGHDFYALGATTKAANAQVSYDNVYGTQVQKVLQDPSVLGSTIEETKALLQADNTAFNPEQKAKRQIADMKGLVNTAITSYMQETPTEAPNFKQAQAVLDKYGPALMGAQAGMQDTINARRDAYYNRQALESHKAEIAHDKAIRVEQATNAANLGVAMLTLAPSDPGRSAIVNQAESLFYQGKISERALHVLSGGITSSTALPDNTDADRKQRYLMQIKTGVFDNLSENILEDNVLSERSKGEMLKEVNASHARGLKAAGDPEFGRKLDIGSKMVEGFQTQGPMGVGPVIRIPDKNQMQLDFNKSVDQGIDPVQAAKNVITGYHNKVNLLSYLDTNIVPLHDQLTFDSLQKSMPVIRQKINGLTDIKKANQMKQILLDRMNALRALEAEKPRGR